MMNLRPPPTSPRIYFYLFFFAIFLGGLMHSTTIISSSHSLDYRANGPIDYKRDVELFYQNNGFGRVQGNSIILSASYNNGNSPLLRELKQLLLQAPTARIAPQVLADTTDGKSTSIVILLADQADVSSAYAMKDQEARGWFVYNTLTQHAARTQIGLQGFLKSRGVTYQSFWAANMMVATAHRSLVDQLAARPDVARIDSNQPTRWIEEPVVEKLGISSDSTNTTDTAEWGVLNVNAPAVWALGFTGQGIVIANEDTGMRWTHNALKPKYRGWNGSSADHNFNWHDSIHTGGGSCGANSVAPCDDSGHGTHTTGTTVGDDGAGNQVGVAPGAKWIGCRNMDQGNGTPARYIECMEWFLAPYPIGGGQGDPLRAPDVTNNSWTCPPSEGCSVATLQAAVEAQAAAGIMMVVNAGSQGPACSTVQDPPAIYAAAYSVGALITGTDNVASFSSRGPVIIDGSNRIKPDITAPGTTIRSSYNGSDSDYAILSGTSMATPHIAGAMALLWCAQPQLRHNISGSRTALNEAAFFLAYKQCGTPGPPNNVSGWGRVDILAAAAPTSTCPPGTSREIALNENFDGVTPPALPPFWVATNAQGPPPLWVTSNSGVPTPPAYSPPNAAYIDDPDVVSDKRLASQDYFSFEGFMPQLTFRHNFNLEASDTDPNLGFDGGVLEVSVDGGQTFQYIPPESFVTGGYNRTISNNRGSPIAGLRAWSGNSDGFITTVVNLPLNGTLRWRMGSDTSGSSEGWRVDDATIY